MKAAHLELLPPAHVPLDEGDMPFFANVIQEFAKADWSPHQLELAALLARSLHDFSVEQMMMRDEGAVIQGDKGMVPNPRKAVMGMHAQTIMNFRRTLALHAAAGGEKQHIAKRIDIAKSVQAHEIQGQEPYNEELISRA